MKVPRVELTSKRGLLHPNGLQPEISALRLRVKVWLFRKGCNRLEDPELAPKGMSIESLIHSIIMVRANMY